MTTRNHLLHRARSLSSSEFRNLCRYKFLRFRSVEDLRKSRHCFEHRGSFGSCRPKARKCLLEHLHRRLDLHHSHLHVSFVGGRLRHRRALRSRWNFGCRLCLHHRVWHGRVSTPPIGGVKNSSTRCCRKNPRLAFEEERGDPTSRGTGKPKLLSIPSLRS